MAMNGPCRRGDDAWMKRATTSLPVPVSPCRHVVTSVAATRAARSTTSHHTLDVPTRWDADRWPRGDRKLFVSTVALMTASNMPDSRSANEFIRGGDDGRRKEIFETRDVAILSGCDEGLEETLVLGRTRGRPSVARDVLPRARHDLPRVGLRKPKDVRDVAVRVVERLTKDVGSSFGGRQRLQKHPDATRQRLIPFRGHARVGAGVDWFRLAGLDARFPPCACRLHDVDRQSSRRRRQECRGVTDNAAIRRLPA